jgi:hypothetical protein
MYILTDPIYGQDYKDGYVFFSYTTGSIVSAGIALFQSYEDVLHQPLSHCGVISGPNMCVEATDPKVMESNFVEKYVNDPHTIVFFRKPKDLTPADGKIMVDTSRKFLGKKYSYLGIAGSALYVFLTAGYKCFPWLRYYRNPLNSKNTLFCSELVAEAMRPVKGKVGCLKYDPSNIYPITLFDDKVIWSDWKFDIAQVKIAEGKKVIEVK